ncbi:hypothetical protein LVD16_14140 [Fulvivirga ligni]|nr:hypothetical protein LVD16_14140 [Fulvivirga ligni]
MLPFFVVRDPGLKTVEDQLNISPYYKVVRSQYWRMVGGQPQRVDPGLDISYTLEQTYGIETFQLEELSSSLSIGFTAENEVSFEGGIGQGNIGARVSQIFSKDFNLSRKQVNSVTETNLITVTITRSTNVDIPSVLAEYQLVDHYQLVSMDNKILSEWEVGGETQFNSVVGFPAQSAARVSSSPLIISSTNNPLMDKALTVEITSKNPFTSQLELEVNAPVSAQIEATLYDTYGDKKQQVSEFLSNEGKTKFSIKGDGLPKGIYILKTSFIDKDGELHQDIKRVIKE